MADPTGANLTDAQVQDLETQDPDHISVKLRKHNIGARLQALRADADANTAARTTNTSDIATLQGAELKLATLQVTAAELDAAATSQTFDVVTPSATVDALVLDAWFKLDTVVAGGSISACTLQVGNDIPTADPDAYVLADDVFTGASTGYRGTGYTEKGADLVTVNTADYGRNTAIVPATNKVTATVTSTGDNVDAATTGDMTVYVLYRLLG